MYFLKEELYFLYSIIVFLFYLVKYFDGDEFTGFRNWQWLRKYTLFGKPTVIYYGNPAAFTASEVRDKMLFVVIGNLSNMGLIHGFGMHGGSFLPQMDLVYMLPWILFKIPILRDLLMWTGAVSRGRSDTEGHILSLLRKGKSVAYCPSNMEDYVNFSAGGVNIGSPTSEKVVVSVPSLSIFEFAIKHNISVVPVLIKNESQRYKFLKVPFNIQKWTYERIGWPFPFFFYPKIFDNKPPVKLDIQIGTPMQGAIHASAESFFKLFMGQFSGMVEVGGDSRDVMI